MLDELNGLAKEVSPAARQLLLRRVTDMFFETETERSGAENTLFEEIVLRTCRQIERDGRVELSNRIADERRAPRGVVMALARDTIDVAAPVLERSPVLGNAELAELAEEASDDHLLSISGRRGLNAIVTDVLARRGNSPVLRSLARNEDAIVSSYGFETMLRRSRGDRALQLDLAHRRDIPDEMREGLAGLMAEEMDSDAVTAAVDFPDHVMATIERHVDNASRQLARELRDTAAVVHDLRQGEVSRDEVMVTMARSDQAYELATVLSALTNVPHATAMAALTGTTTEPLLVLCRSIDLPWSTFEPLLQLRARRRREIYKPSGQVQRTYEDMPPPMAQRILRFLAVRRAAGAAVH